MSYVAWLVAAVLLQGLLTLATLGVLSFVRVQLLKAGAVRAADVVLSREPWPAKAKQASNTFDNQFQLPVLFYVASLVALWLGPTLIELALAYVFVVTRYVHAAIHITSNNVVRRFAAYTTGLVVLCVFWADLLVRTLLVAFGAN